MPVDIRKGLQFAVESALPSRSSSRKHGTPHLGTGPALLSGAGLVTGGRLVARPLVRDLRESLQEWVSSEDDEATAGQDEDFEEEEPEAEEEDEDFDDEEPEAEED